MTECRETDEWLMAQVAAGRRELLTVLVRRYANPLLTFLVRMTNDHHRAEELFQEVFLQVWLKRRQYQAPRPFRSWLFAIAANHGRAAFRRARPRDASLDGAGEPLSVSGSSPIDAAIAVETCEAVAAAVAQLPAKQRQVIVLRIWNGLSFAEIAQAIGAAEVTARSHMHHGLNAMRRYLEPKLRDA
ncbi:MAG: sigma-70 family RNA polymerase sigma factor [Planctomycetales bacterium]|nr:sigma-70 family RNA polymerase sigma factor [Planctomycetales bacterium]